MTGSTGDPPRTPTTAIAELLDDLVARLREEQVRNAPTRTARSQALFGEAADALEAARKHDDHCRLEPLLAAAEARAEAAERELAMYKRQHELDAQTIASHSATTQNPDSAQQEAK